MKTMFAGIWSHRSEIGLWLGVVLVGVLGYEAGFVQGVRQGSPPIVIEKPTLSVATSEAAGMPAAETTTSAPGGTGTARADSTPAATGNSQGSIAPTASPAIDQKTCPYVGSRNSNKDHLVTCAVAKRIKPENRVCFVSPEDAQAKNYQPGCIK